MTARLSRTSAPALILVEGAFGSRTFGATRPLAALLATQFTVYSHDRRGRGDSADTAPFAVEREIEDLAAVFEAAGGSAHQYGISPSPGASLALEAATRGLPVRRLALHEARSSSAPPARRSLRFRRAPRPSLPPRIAAARR